MDNQTKTIRDFIYLDADRLNSLYSQVFEGVAEEIVKSRLFGEVQQNTQSGPITEGQIAEAQFAEVKQTTENKVLYDYMYSQLETKIAGGILQPSGITSDNYREILGKAFMVKVKGRTEIEDYDRVQAFAKQYNDLVSGAAFAETMTPLGMSLYKLEALAESAQGDQKGQLRQAVKKFKNSKQLAKDKGYYQDEEMLSFIELVTQMFYPNGFETTISPTEGIEGIVFRGVIDKQWLRLQPSFLKALYGGYTEFEWTMVGQITYMPGGETLEIPPMIPPNAQATVEQNVNNDETTEEDETEGPAAATPQIPTELPSMRDPFRTVFGGLTRLERMFLESKQRVEVIMHPLAIYRETLLPGGEKATPSS